MDTHPDSQPRSLLVDDLIPEIFESINWWPADLLRLSYVSSAWLNCARKLLYTHPTLRTFRSCLLFARTISESSYLLPLISGIAVCPLAGSRLFGAEEMRAVRKILNLEGLVSVTLGGELAVGAERFLNTMFDCRSIKVLYIDGSFLSNSIRSPPSLEWDEVLACRFSGVEILRLSHLDLDVAFPSVPYELALKELVLCDVRIISGTLIHLLQQNATDLKRFVVSGQSSFELDEHVGAVLQSYNIESLQYQVQCSHPWTSSLFDMDLTPASSLQYLYLDGVRIDPEILNKIYTYFPFLRHFSVSGRRVCLTLEDWAAFIQSGVLTELRRLGLPGGTYYPPFKKWAPQLEPAVQMACSLRGVVLMYHPTRADL